MTPYIYPLFKALLKAPCYIMWEGVPQMRFHAWQAEYWTRLTWFIVALQGFSQPYLEIPGIEYGTFCL